jgi:hypothetical protein
MSGLIYAAIVVAWAAYLVPLALRRHDEKVRARSVDRFSAAMRVLARHPADSVTTPSGQLLNAERVADPAPPRRPPSRQAARVAAARRRRVLLVLLAVAAAVGGATAAGYLPWWSSAVPVAPVLGWLVACRRQVRRQDEAYWAWSQAMEAQREPSVVVRERRQGEPAAERAVGSPSESVPEPLAQPERAVAVSVPTADGGSLWDPLPVTLPTYLSKPKAPRTVRAISLGEPGTWTSGRLEPPAAPPAADASPAVVEPTEQSEPRRAVGS